MPEYAILLSPGHSRVYYESSLKLSACELEAAAARLHSACTDIKTRYIGNIAYLTFFSSNEPDEPDLAIISNLSFAYAFFEVKSLSGQEVLLPIQKRAEEFIDAGISAMLKYSGKTNELFTKMMINLAFFACKTGAGRPRLLDPVAGKGTTILEGLVMGFDVAGIELMDKPVRELEVFLKKYLENAKYKHSYKKERVSGTNPAFRASVHLFEMAKTKEDFKSRDRIRSLSLVSGDSRFAERYFKKNSFDMIVGDLPYGVAHGNVTGGRGGGSPTRSPAELLAICLPAWHAVLKKGGSLAISWNAFVMPRFKMAEVISKNGFEVLQGVVYDNFEHRVDQAIKRDIIVAVKN